MSRPALFGVGLLVSATVFILFAIVPDPLARLYYAEQLSARHYYKHPRNTGRAYSVRAAVSQKPRPIDFPTRFTVQTHRQMDTKDEFLSKAAVELTFSFNKSQWAKAAYTVVAADWIVEFHDHDNGREVIAVDPSTKIGLSVHPHFRDEKSPADLLIIRNYYPVGALGSLTEEGMTINRSRTQKGLGGAYRVKLRFNVMEENEVVEFRVTEL